MNQETQQAGGARKRVLFVDDEPAVLDSLRRLLRRERYEWDAGFLNDSREALGELLHSDYDAVVSDVQMPEMDGFELLRRLRQDERTIDLPVVILTGSTEQGLKRKALDLGATDLLNKPVDKGELIARLRSVLRLKACQDELRDRNQVLAAKVRERTREVEASRLDIIWRLGKAAEFRDTDTGNHILRVGYYSRVIAEQLAPNRAFADHLFLAAPLHDIGKIAVPDSILLKTGPLTKDEWHIMRQHCRMGAAILQERSNVEQAYAECNPSAIDDQCMRIENPILELAATVALTHHEKWNGTGYPRGLAQNDIPLAGRIVAIADVYDALTSERPYKPAYSLERALAVLRSDVEKHFDPDVFAAFESSLETIVAIGDEFADEGDVVVRP